VSNVSAFAAAPVVFNPSKQSNVLNLNPQPFDGEKELHSSTVQLRASTIAYDTQPSPLDAMSKFVTARLPGIALTAAMAKVSVALSKIPSCSHVSPLLWATILGMAYGNILHKDEGKRILSTGIKFSKARLLRLGIILYGFKITLQQIAGIGFAGLGTDVVMLSSTLAMGILLGTRVFKLDEATSTLIGAGAAICGCSAVLATQPVAGGESHQVSAAVGTVVLGGTASMFLYPLLFKYIPFLAASPKLMGIYTGSTIHEVAGVVAAGNAMGGEVATVAVVTKLARVLLLAPALTFLSWIKNEKCLREAKAAGLTYAKSNCKLVLPWFAFYFVGISAVNSVMSFPTALVKIASKTSAFTLLCAMAALGIESDFKEIRKLGPRPLLLASVLWAWLAVGGLGVARFFMGV
jgi:uncharacterized integral membrane protein (TIGR00698 family)